jgi:hypothetical protein
MNTTTRILIVGALGYYFYDRYKVKLSPLSDYKDVPVIDPDYKPILNPEPGQIEDLIKQEQQTTVTNTANSSYEQFFNPVTTTTTTTPEYTNMFNNDNPFDPSGFDPSIYAGGYADSYSAYS